MIKKLFFSNKLEHDVNYDKSYVFNLVLKYKFNIELLLRISNEGITNEIVDLVNATRLDLTYFYCINYYSKYICDPKNKDKSNIVNFGNNYGFNYKLAAYYFNKLTYEEKEQIYNSIDHSKFDALGNNHNIILILGLKSTFFNFNYTIKHDIDNVHLFIKKYVNDKKYDIIYYIRMLKLSLVFMCTINTKYVNDVVCYYLKLRQINITIASRVILNFICKYKFTSDCILIKTLFSNDLLFEYDYERMNKLKRLFKDFILKVLETPNCYYKSVKLYKTKDNNMVINNLKDFDVSNKVINRYEYMKLSYERSHVLRPIKDKCVIHNKLFKKSVYKTYKQKLIG